MLPWLPALLLAWPAHASDAPPALFKCLSNETGVRTFYHGLDAEERAEFDGLYSAYAEMVERRKEAGWSSGYTGNLATNFANAFQDHGALGLVRAGRTWEESRLALEDKVKEAKEALRAAAPAERAAARTRLKELLAFQRHRFGVCNDWAEETFEVIYRRPRRFFIPKKTIRNESHANVEVCARDARRCVVFDPWRRGFPELVTPAEAEQGPRKANSCFSVYPP